MPLYPHTHTHAHTGSTDGNVRLVGRDGHARGRGGRVEVSFGDVWHTISQTSSTIQDTDVICRQLGFPTSLYRGIVADLG